jgi:hypothetical protein
VAKRNFRKRHKHGGDNIARGGDDDSGDDCVPVKRGIPSQITASREEDEEADGISSQSADSTNIQEKKIESEDVEQQGIARNPMRTADVPKDVLINGANESLEVPLPNESKISEERKRRWVTLLAKRPSTKDGDSMSGWLMEVLAVSDLETPLKPSETAEEDAKMKTSKKRDKMDEPQKKRAEKNSNDSEYSDSHSENSSNDDNKKESKDKNSSVAFNNSIVKKKRPSSELLRDSSEQKAKSNSYVRGSFAEWKERKKQKKQSKSGNNNNPTQSDNA